MHSLPDRDNIKPRLGRERSCHSSLGQLGYREDPLLRPFITKHRSLPVGLWSGTPKKKRGGGLLHREKNEADKGRWRNPTGRHMRALPSLQPSLHRTVLYPALLQHRSDKDRRPSGEQAPNWSIGLKKKWEYSKLIIDKLINSNNKTWNYCLFLLLSAKIGLTRLNSTLVVFKTVNCSGCISLSYAFFFFYKSCFKKASSRNALFVCF